MEKLTSPSVVEFKAEEFASGKVWSMSSNRRASNSFRWASICASAAASCNKQINVLKLILF
jgi:hypothetical protein